MLKDWSEENPPQDDPEPEKVRSLDNPIRGMCISVCVFVISLMLGFYNLCGPHGSGGYNRSSDQISFGMGFALFLFFGSIAGGIGCFLWYLGRAFRNYYRND